MPEIMNWDEIRRISRIRWARSGRIRSITTTAQAACGRSRVGDRPPAATSSAIETGTAPRHFAYPYGYENAVGQREVMLVRDGRLRPSAVTTRHGMLQTGHRDHPPSPAAPVHQRPLSAENRLCPHHAVGPDCAGGKPQAAGHRVTRGFLSLGSVSIHLMITMAGSTHRKPVRKK